MCVCVCVCGPWPKKNQLPKGICPSIRLYVVLLPPLAVPRPSQPGVRPTRPGLRPSQPGLRPNWPGLRSSQPGVRPTQPGLSPSHPGLRPNQRHALGHKKVGTKYVTEENSSGFSRWRTGIGHFRFHNMTLCYCVSSENSLIVHFIAS